MAGVNPGFDATAFTEGIRFAMEMGAPVTPTDRATFRFPKVTSYPAGTRLDREGRPLNPNIPRTEGTVRPDIQVDVAIEYDAPSNTSGNINQTAVGKFPLVGVVLTLFQEDYLIVKDAREVIIGGDTYIVDHRPPPLALFNVGFQQIVLLAKDET